jgi:CMD domain protein
MTTTQPDTPHPDAAPTTDVISALAGIQPGSALAALRAERPEAMQHAQGSYAALFDPAASTGLSPVERFATALRVATHHAATEAAAHYRRRLADAGADPEVVADSAPLRLQAMLAHADLLAAHPAQAGPDNLQALADAGLSAAEIVTLSQIIAFVSFQVRVLVALKLLGAEGSTEPEAPTPAPTQPASAPPSTQPAARITRPDETLNRPRAFTLEELAWMPWLDPIELADATPEQRAALERRSGNSPYFRLLAHDAAVLSERTATDLGIFFTHGGTSGADLQLDERWQAVVDAAVALSRTPSEATSEHVGRLRVAGLSDLEILDVLQSAAFFSWANRLMLTLGEPHYPDEASA